MSELLEPPQSTLFPETIETERLRIERLCHDTVDLPEYHRICSAGEAIDEVTEYLSWDPHESIRETREFVDMAENQWESSESAAYVLRPRDAEDGAGDIAGGAGISFDWDREMGTLGVWLRKRFWGRGYSGERATAFLKLAFERLGLETVAVEHQTGNRKSRRAIEKYVEQFGGSYDGSFRNWAVKAEEAYDQRRYTIRREEYRQATA
jgi:RimJ/RimL family protein N-acetyltransferase